MAERTGLEPATSDVTGRRSNQLNYRSKIFKDGVRPRRLIEFDDEGRTSAAAAAHNFNSPYEI